MATESDLSDLNETSMAKDSHDISCEDTMVKHSVIVNEEIYQEVDYLKAFDCARFENKDGESGTIISKYGSSGGGASGNFLVSE